MPTRRPRTSRAPRITAAVASAPVGSTTSFMRFLWERMKLVVEPTGALATAAVMRGALDVRGRRVGIILSGGNVDLKAVAALFA